LASSQVPGVVSHMDFIWDPFLYATETVVKDALAGLNTNTLSDPRNGRCSLLEEISKMLPVHIPR
jgi:hypothetical protein